MKVSLISILEKELIGKTVKIETVTPITEKYTIDVKKSHNVTDKQFDSGDKKYRMKSTKTRKIGNAKKIDYHKIERVELSTLGYQDDIYLTLIMIDGTQHEFHEYDEICIVDRQEKLERILKK